MHRERVSENVFWFQSEVYAQVTAGVIVGPQWAVVIDTLALPEETLGMRGNTGVCQVPQRLLDGFCVHCVLIAAPCATGT